MTPEQRARLGELAVWIATAQELTAKAQAAAYRTDMLPAQELTAKAQAAAYRTDMLPLTADYGGFIARANYYLGLAALEMMEQQAKEATNG